MTGQEVQFANAIDHATTFIVGTGHQMELEAIRSRTREALRSRVRNGQIAGGCFGYKLERKCDASGRKFTIAIVNEVEAPIVRRIFIEYLANRGLRAIAHDLNADGIPAPSAAAVRGRQVRSGRSCSPPVTAASTSTVGSRREDHSRAARSTAARSTRSAGSRGASAAARSSARACGRSVAHP